MKTGDVSRCIVATSRTSPMGGKAGMGETERGAIVGADVRAAVSLPRGTRDLRRVRGCFWCVCG